MGIHGFMAKNIAPEDLRDDYVIALGPHCTMSSSQSSSSSSWYYKVNKYR